VQQLGCSAVWRLLQVLVGIPRRIALPRLSLRLHENGAGRGVLLPRRELKEGTRTQVFLNRLLGGHLFNQLAGDEACFLTHPTRSGRTLTIP
jgi:hypothetical protein